MLDNYSIDNLSIEIYENQFFKSDFTPIREYIFRLSIFTTLNIYIKTILRAIKGSVNVRQSFVMQIVIGNKVCPNLSFS